VPNTQIIKALSHPRMTTYLSATYQNQTKALELYIWNSQVSAALLVPMHIFEILIRNAVAEIFELQFGHQWPWQRSLERTLPQKYRDELIKAREKRGINNRTSKVIPELTFNFWQQMFVSRYNQQFWKPHLHSLFPNAPANMPCDQLRGSIFNDLDTIRKLRNRIAHHEPIINQNIYSVMNKIERLTYYRCEVTSSWANQHYQVRNLLLVRP
jgi:hypothetical protein